MTLAQVIEIVDSIKPNSFTDNQKTRWINECEGTVQLDVLLLNSIELEIYDYERHKDMELIIPAPHDKVYIAYLYAMIDFANGEYEKYQNSMQMFNAQMAEYIRFIARTFSPADYAYSKDI